MLVMQKKGRGERRGGRGGKIACLYIVRNLGKLTLFIKKPKFQPALWIKFFFFKKKRCVCVCVWREREKILWVLFTFATSSGFRNWYCCCGFWGHFIDYFKIEKKFQYKKIFFLDEIMLK